MTNQSKANQSNPPSGFVTVTNTGDLSHIMSATNLSYLATTEDPAAVVLRAHLVTEECLNLWIRKVTNSPTIFDNGFFPYKLKLQVAGSLGHPKPIDTAFNRLNNVRNRFAHRIEASSLQQGDLDALKISIEAIKAPSLGDWGKEVRTGAPKEGIVLKYDAPLTTDCQRLSVLFDHLVIKVVVIYKEELGKRGVSIAI